MSPHYHGVYWPAYYRGMQYEDKGWIIVMEAMYRRKFNFFSKICECPIDWNAPKTPPSTPILAPTPMTLPEPGPRCNRRYTM